MSAKEASHNTEEKQEEEFMARRPVFTAMEHFPYVREVSTDFQFHPGFSLSQAQKSIASLHDAYIQKFPGDCGKVLEISTKSSQVLGNMLSAFCLKYQFSSGNQFPVENVFQSGKCFEHGGPYTDLLTQSARAAKKDIRLRNSGHVTHFVLDGIHFPSEPRTAFYHWIYINALSQNPHLANQILDFNAFTDIAFNPEKSLNCQARSAAVFVSLYRCGLLKKALSSIDSFMHIVYENSACSCSEEPQQPSAFHLADRP